MDEILPEQKGRDLRLEYPSIQGIHGTTKDVGHQAGPEKEWPEASISWQKVLRRTSHHMLEASQCPAHAIQLVNIAVLSIVTVPVGGGGR